MKEISATDAARQFSRMLDAVEHDDESFRVIRAGKLIATITPVHVASGALVKALMRRIEPDALWETELETLRAGLAIEDRPWHA